MNDLITYRPEGIYVPAAKTYIDPHRGVDTHAVITHAHADHARRGHKAYYATHATGTLLSTRYRIHGANTRDYDEAFIIEGVRFTFYPAGHILGSAQVLIEHDGQRCVVTGDFNPYPSPLIQPYRPIQCDHLVMECTFGLPIYHWPKPEHEIERLMDWWRSNRRMGRSSVVTAYSLGKTQRLIAMLEEQSDGIGIHSSAASMCEAYRDAGAALPHVRIVDESTDIDWLREALIIAPQSSLKGQWARRLTHPSMASASGWNATSRRRQKGFEAHFILSDHADWRGLLDAADDSTAQRIDVMHGFTEVFAHHLCGMGYDARVADL